MAEAREAETWGMQADRVLAVIDQRHDRAEASVVVVVMTLGGIVIVRVIDGCVMIIIVRVGIL